MTKKENFLKGFIKENPLFVLLLGTCPSLAITTSLSNALGMGLAFLVVMVLSNMIISLINSNEKIKALIQPVRIAVYIVVIATLVTVVEMLLKAYLPELHESLGVFISLITVNCIVLGRAEAYASSNKVSDSIIDGISMALGYTLALIIISVLREFLGNGTLTLWGSYSSVSDAVKNNVLICESGNIVLNLRCVFEFIGIEPISFFTSSAGAFLVLGIVLAFIQMLKNNKEEKEKNAKKEVK